MKWPKISIVIPGYNEEKNIDRCLRNIIKQDYPLNNLELVFVDDKSKDRTVEIVKKYKNKFGSLKILFSGKHVCEISKSLGIQNTSHNLLLMIDADNVFVKKDSIKRLAKPIIEDNKIVASYPIWFDYNKKYSKIDNYCSLFGINDPLQYYLQRRDRLMWTEKNWTLTKNYIDKKDYFRVKIDADKDMLTLGTIGFLVRKEAVLKTDYKPLFYHIDSTYEFIKKGYDTFAMVKIPIAHYHSESIKDFFGKIRRNIILYYQFIGRRKFKWATGKKLSLVIAVLKASTIIVPLFDSIKGFIKLPTWIWFLHPYICLRAVFIYTWYSIFKQKIE